MSGQLKTRSLVEGAMLSTITVILSIASIYIPVLGVFVSFVWPVPIILLCIRQGLKVSIMASIVSALLVIMIAEPIQAITVILGFGLMGVSMGYAISKGYSSTGVLTAGTVASLVSKLVLVLAYLLIMGINPFIEQFAIMEESIPGIIEMYRNFGMAEENLAQVENLLTNVAQMTRLIFPAALAFAAVFDAFINFVVARLILGKLGTKIDDLPPFKNWRLPEYTMFVYLIVLIAGIFIESSSLMVQVASNLMYGLSFLFIIQGLAVGEFYLEKKQFAKIPRRLILLIAMFLPLINNGLLLAGILDSAFDFRKLRNKEVWK